MRKRCIIIIMALVLVGSVIPDTATVSAYSEPPVTNTDITYPISLSTGKDAKGKLVFPDREFLNYVAQETFKSGKYQSYPFDLDQNGELSEMECDLVRYIGTKTNKNITSIEGIEAFPKLRELYCDSTGIQELDVSANPYLQKLCCASNDLKTLDVSHCTNLIELDCSRCGILNLDLTNNKELIYLTCYGQKVNAYEYQQDNRYLCNIWDFGFNIDLTKISNLKIDGAYGDNINSGYYSDTGTVYCSDKMQKIRYDYNIDVSATRVTDVKSFDVTFYLKDGTRQAYETDGGSRMLPQFIERGNSDVEPSAPKKDGYTFVGWYTDSTYLPQSEWIFGSAVETNMTLFAKWEKKTYQVDYNPAGGMPDLKSREADWWTKNLLPTTGVSRLGYTLAGWESSVGVVVNESNAERLSYGDIFKNSDSDKMTLTAVWQVKSNYRMNYDSNLSAKQKKRMHRAPKYNPSKTYAWNQKQLIPQFSEGYLIGYDFVGWYTAKSGGKQITPDMTYEELYSMRFQGDSELNIPTVYARYKKAQYKIQYHTSGGTKIPQRTGVLYGTKNLLPKVKPKKKGFRLIGWKYGKKKITKKTRLEGKMAASPYIKLTAVWKKNKQAAFTKVSRRKGAGGKRNSRR